MEFQRFIECSFIVTMVLFVGSSECYQFNVGGRNGWVLNPSENYTTWPHRHRFQVNDTLFFKYKKGSDSALVVNKDDFESCNTQNPKHILTDGDSIFKFDRSGPFYFISGYSNRCKKGQKLVVIVMAVKSQPSNSPRSPSNSGSGSKGAAGVLWLVSGVIWGANVMLGSFV